MTIIDLREVHVWTASPQNVDETQWPTLTGWLDKHELLRAQHFRMQADRRAYMLAHALRRMALASALGVASTSLSFSSEASGKPVLASPPGQKIYFSHAHTRNLVGCVVTRFAPVGIDVESIVNGNADLELLTGLVTLPAAQHRASQLGSDLTRQFFHYWTTLEAYWKARGCGLTSANPPIRCEQLLPGVFEVALDSGQPSNHCACAIVLNAPPDCMATLVLDACPTDATANALEIIHHAPDFSKLAQAQHAHPSPCITPFRLLSRSAISHKVVHNFSATAIL